MGTIAELYPVNTRLTGKVTNITDYGCFVELAEGVEGLVHMSEMDWSNKNIHPSKVVKAGEEIDVIVLDMNIDRRRISLGIKQCQDNPWEAFAKQHQVGEIISGKIRSITDFGLFIGLEGGIDGLIHLSDIAWNEEEANSEELLRQYTKGSEVETVILTIDPERERIALGVKQLTGDPVLEFVNECVTKETALQAKVIKIEAKQAVLQLNDDITGVMRLSDYSYDRVTDLRQELKEAETIEVKVLNFDAKTRQVLLSHKVLETPPDAVTGARSVGMNKPTKTTLGDLLKEQMRQDGKESKNVSSDSKEK